MCVCVCDHSFYYYYVFSSQTQNDRIVVSHRMLSHRIAVRNIRNQMSETLCFTKKKKKKRCVVMPDMHAYYIKQKW